MTSKNNVKFLMILNHIDWFWSHRLPLARGILDKGWDLHLATHTADQNARLGDMNVTGHAMPPYGRGFNPAALFMQLYALYQLIKQTKPDVIHAITIRTAFFAGLITRFMGYKPVTFTVAGLGSLYTAPGLKMKIIRLIVLPLIKFAFGGAGKFIIFQNPDDQQAMVNAGVIAKDRNVIIRGSGVDLTEFPFSEYEDGEDEPIILFTSRLLKEKGIEEFIRAAKHLKSQGVNARFQVAGDVYPDNARSMTRAEMQHAHDVGIIEWLGQCGDMPDLLRRSMMVVLPSYYGEGVPKVLLETAAIGRPIITCDSPGCREAVEHDVNGILVAPQDTKELAVAIKELINDPRRRKRYGEAGRKRVEEDFHVDAVVSRTLEVYDRLLEEVK